MWRSFRYSLSKSKISSLSSKKLQRSYSSSSSGGSGKAIFGLIAGTGVGFAGAVVYGKYDPKFRKVLQDNIPFIDNVYRLFPDDGEQKPSISSKSASDDRSKDVPGSLLRKKVDRERSSVEVQRNIDRKPKETGAQANATENLVSDIVKNLLKSSEEAKVSYDSAVSAIKSHTKSLYDALELPEGKDEDIVWREVNTARSNKNDALRLAEDKALQTNAIMEKLNIYVRKIDPKSPLVKTAEDCISTVEELLRKSKDEVSSVQTEANTAAEYQKLIASNKEQFKRELEIVLPNYIYGDKDKDVSESDLNLLIAHAHRRIEQLQKKLAKQQVSEKAKIDEAVRNQKVMDDRLAESKIETELERRHIDLESAVTERVASLKENFENELRKQLRRQAAAHADHIQEVLKVQEQELDRKFSLDLDEKLLHQKGIFISETSGNMARLKGILAFLKARSDFDAASKKAQALWLACQSMNDKVSADNKGDPFPLGKDIAAVKIAADDDSEFISSILAGIPSEAVSRGVYNSEVLKERFQDVKKVCKRVALIDENNDSLFRYFLSYLQSFLIIDHISIPKAELDGKVAVDPSEWDTFDVLNRIAFCLKINDLEQALRYANQLRGEPRQVAKDWMNEVRLLLETKLAVKALLAHAAAVGVQAYH